MKSIYVDAFVASKIKEINFGRAVEVGNLIIQEDAPTPYIAIAAEEQNIEYVTFAAKSDVKLNVFLFDKEYEPLIGMTEKVADALHNSTGEFEGVAVNGCKLATVVKDYYGGVYGIILTFRMEVIEEMQE
jgi:hypothetical protein